MLNAPSSSRALVRRVLGYRLYNEAVHTGDGVVNRQLCAETSREVPRLLPSHTSTHTFTKPESTT